MIDPELLRAVEADLVPSVAACDHLAEAVEVDLVDHADHARRTGEYVLDVLLRGDDDPGGGGPVAPVVPTPSGGATR